MQLPSAPQRWGAAATRRRLGVGVVSGAGAAALAACGAGGGGGALARPELTKEKITLTWASPGDQAEFDVYVKVAEQFTREHPNITVVNDAAASAKDKLTTLAASDSL